MRDLTGLVSDIDGRFRQQRNVQQQLPVSVVSQPIQGYWKCETGNTLAAYAAGTDFDSAFNADGAALYKWKQPTSGGEITIPAFSTTYPTRAMLWFRCAKPIITTGILFMNGGNVQIKSTGLDVLSDYTVTTAIEFRFKTGLNAIRIASDGGGENPYLCIGVLDGVECAWTNHEYNTRRAKV